MNILILSWRDPKNPNSGGAESVTLRYAKGWITAGHSVTWFSSSFDQSKRDEYTEGVHVKRFGYYAVGVQVAAFFWYLFNGEKFNLVIDQFHGLPFFTPIYVRKKRLAFIHEIAGEVWKLNPWPWPFNKVVSVVGPFVEPLIFKLFYKQTPFFTVSESTRDDLMRLGIPEENIKVIHNGVDLSGLPKSLPPKENKKTAIFLGAISEDKGIKDAIATFDMIRKSSSGWQFWIVGKASLQMKNFLQEEIARKGLESSVTYFGYVSNKKKFELLARAHIMINPSVHEGWGLVNIEANAVGTSVVAYKVQGIKDSVKDEETGVLVERYFGPDGLAKAAQEIVESPQRLLKFSQNATKWSKKFSWEKSISKNLKLIRSV